MQGFALSVRLSGRARRVTVCRKAKTPGSHILRSKAWGFGQVLILRRLALISRRNCSSLCMKSANRLPDVSQNEVDHPERKHSRYHLPVFGVNGPIERHSSWTRLSQPLTPLCQQPPLPPAMLPHPTLDPQSTETMRSHSGTLAHFSLTNIPAYSYGLASAC